MDEDSARPAWAVGLKRSGLYYEGFVDNLENTLEAHRRCTVSTYGTRTSKKATTLPTDTNIDKENDGYLANKQVRMTSIKMYVCVYQCNASTPGSYRPGDEVSGHQSLSINLCQVHYDWLLTSSFSERGLQH